MGGSGRYSIANGKYAKINFRLKIVYSIIVFNCFCDFFSFHEIKV